MNGLSSARVYFTAPEPAHEAALADAPAAWRAEVFGPAVRGRTVVVWLVCLEVAGGAVVTRQADGHHVAVFVVPRLRGLGIATEATARIAERVLVEEDGARLVGAAPDDAARRVAAKLGAVPTAGGYALDLAAFTALERPPGLDGSRIARLVRSLRPADVAEVSAQAKARADALAAKQAAAKAAKQRPPPEPNAPLATDAEFEATLAACRGNLTMAELQARIAARWYTPKQLEALEDAFDESRFAPRERDPDRTAMASWLYAHRMARGD